MENLLTHAEHYKTNAMTRQLENDLAADAAESSLKHFQDLLPEEAECWDGSFQRAAKCARISVAAMVEIADRQKYGRAWIRQTLIDMANEMSRA